MTERESPERRARALGAEIPPVPIAPAASYASAFVDGITIYLAGHTPQLPGGPLATGIVGRDLDLPEAQACARQCVLNMLSRVRALTGTLDAVEQVIKLTVFVAATEDFPHLHRVSEGASLLVNDLFGPGHIRTTVGVLSLPRRSPVEIDGSVRIIREYAAHLAHST